MKAKKIITMVATTLLKIAIAFVIVIGVYKAAIIAYDFGYRIFAEEAISNAPGIGMSVAIVEGKTPKEIGEILEEKGLIRDAKLFYFQEMFSEYHKKLKPGIYELSTAMTPYEMMQVMSAESSEEDESETDESTSNQSDAGEDTE